MALCDGRPGVSVSKKRSDSFARKLARCLPGYGVDLDALGVDEAAQVGGRVECQVTGSAIVGVGVDGGDALKDFCELVVSIGNGRFAVVGNHHARREGACNSRRLYTCAHRMSK